MVTITSNYILPNKKNIGIKGDRIEIITSDELPAAKLINAIDLAVSPGFIDIHSHADFLIKDNPKTESKIMQGITTEVVGMCGFSPAPVNENYFTDLMDYFTNTVSLSKKEKLEWRWENLYGFYEEIEKEGYVKLIIFCIKEEDIKTILKDSLVMISSDGRAVASNEKYAKAHPHPRYYGTFPRILGRYVREEKVRLFVK